jgi:hypothetical protein
MEVKPLGSNSLRDNQLDMEKTEVSKLLDQSTKEVSKSVMEKPSSISKVENDEMIVCDDQIDSTNYQSECSTPLYSLDNSTPLHSLPISPFPSLPTSPTHVSQSPTPTTSDFEDARSDIVSEYTKEAESMQTRHPEYMSGETYKYDIDQIPDNTLKRRFSKSQNSNHSRSHSRRVSDFSDLELPPLEPLFGPHLHFHPEEGDTPDENDLFPSTPLDEDQLQHADRKLKEQLGNVVINTIHEEELPEEIGWLDPRWLDPRPLMYNAAEQAEEFALNVWHKFQSWNVVGFSNLPQWLQDNDFLRKGHRPPLPSFRECFKSIFRIHTETGNIWTHLLGVVAFFGLAMYFRLR